jgi:hypothetical protein
VVASVDARRTGNRWEIFTHGGRNPTGIDALEHAVKLAELGAGVDDSHVLIRGIDPGTVALDQDPKSRILKIVESCAQTGKDIVPFLAGIVIGQPIKIVLGSYLLDDHGELFGNERLESSNIGDTPWPKPPGLGDPRIDHSSAMNNNTDGWICRFDSKRVR